MGAKRPVLAGLAGAALLATVPAPAGAQTAPSTLRGLIVAVDAGHGGRPPGHGCGPGRVGRRLHEKDLNLETARELARLLRNEGARVRFVRSEDRCVTLRSRILEANMEPVADVFVSVHHNASESAGPNYTQVLANPERADAAPSIELAETIAGLLHHRLAPFGVDLYAGPRPGVEYRPRLAVLKGTSMPAVLVEVSFLSNPAEEARLAQRQYLEANGEAIFRGLLRFYGAAPVVTPIVEPPSPTPPPPAAPEIQPPPERAPTVIAPDPPRGQEPRTSDPQMDSSTDARANSEARPPPRFSTGVKVAAAFLAALGLAALLAWWLLSRKLRREALRPPPTPPSGGPRILVVKGPGCGHRVEVGSGWCEVGRDPSSGLVIASAETTAHVARRHCRVRFDEVARQFDLECLSANGVQLAGGLRLEHGESARIHPGQTLLLGEQTMVRVLAEEGAAERRRAHIVGRSVFCDVVLDDESVSEVHAELTVDGNGTILVADCGSSNGTWLVRSGSEQAIKVRPVAMTDHVRFGGDEHSVAGLLARLGSGADHLVERKRKERVR